MVDVSSPPPPGFDELLRRAAVEPAGPMDVADVGRRARRIRRNRRIGTVAAVLAMVAPASLAGRAFLVPETGVDFASGGGRVIAPATSEPSERSTVASSPSPPPSAEPTEPTVSGGVAVPSPGVSPTPGATASPRPRATGRQSTATVVISDPPGAPERRPDLPGDRAHPDVLLTLVLDTVDVRQGERWKGWLEARNTGEEPVVIGDAECWALWGLYLDGAWVGGQADSVCGERHPQRELQPGALLRVPLAFDTVAGDERGKGMQPLEPGRYTAAAALRVQTSTHGHSGVWYAETLTVTVRPAESE